MALEGNIDFETSLLADWNLKAVNKLKKGHFIQAYHPKIDEDIDLTYIVNESLKEKSGADRLKERTDKAKAEVKTQGQPCVLMSDPEMIPAQSPGDKDSFRLTLLHCTSTRTLWRSAHLLVPILAPDVKAPEWCKNEPLRDKKRVGDRLKDKCYYVVCTEKFTLTVSSDSVAWTGKHLSITEKDIQHLDKVLNDNKDSKLMDYLKSHYTERMNTIAKTERRCEKEKKRKASEQKAMAEVEARAGAKEREIQADDVPNSLTKASAHWAEMRKEASASSQNEGSGAGGDTEAPSTTPGQTKKPRFVAKISRKPASGQE